jgi:NAD-dependent deacetylase
MDPLIAKGVELVRESEKILVFTGAGLSTESGIPDFRSPGGVWDKYDPSDFYFQKFISDEKARVKYWQMSSEFYQGMKNAVPNPAHLSIAELERTGKLLAIVTQNVDRLHHKAGNSPDKIIEIHGTTFSVSCLSCKKGYDRDEIEQRLRSGIKVPYCDDCSGILKPDTISFGQAMPEEKMAQSLAHAHNCDLCIVLGSSLVVYPAASVPIQAVETGARLMIINRDETPLDPRATLTIHDSVGKTLEEIMEKLLH